MICTRCTLPAQCQLGEVPATPHPLHHPHIGIEQDRVDGFSITDQIIYKKEQHILMAKFL